MTEETTDKSIKNQLSIIARYFLKAYTLTEQCIDVIDQSNLQHKAVADTIYRYR